MSKVAFSGLLKQRDTSWIGLVSPPDTRKKSHLPRKPYTIVSETFENQSMIFLVKRIRERKNPVAVSLSKQCRNNTSRVPHINSKNCNLLKPLVAQCSATPATVAATPLCSATPFQTQISVRHLPAHGGGGGATPKFLGGVARHRCYTCKTL